MQASLTAMDGADRAKISTDNYMAEKETKKSAHERLFKFVLQQEFDERYVLKEGDYRLIRALVVGVAGLILTGVIVAALAWVIHAPK